MRRSCDGLGWAWEGNDCRRDALCRTSPEGERHRLVHPRKAAATRQERFSRTDKQESRGYQQASEPLHGLFLCRTVEINQKISAKNDIVRAFVELKVGGEEISLPKVHLVAEPL